MAEVTGISWADATVNFWAGCSKMSPACDNCYAERMAGRLWGVKWGPGEPRKAFEGAAQTLVKLNAKASRKGRKLRVFINSLSDLFDNEVDDEDRQTAFEVMSWCDSLVFIVLTKRIGLVARYLQGDELAAQLVASGRVWLGATICNQAEADRDIGKLLAVRAAVRFLSVEPMLGPVDLSRWLVRCDVGSMPGPGGSGGVTCEECNGQGDGCARLHWVICGGESGRLARAVRADWVKCLRDQCSAAAVPFHFKQWGEYLPEGQSPDVEGLVPVPRSGWVWDDGEKAWRIGVRAAGAGLDGASHRAFPVFWADQAPV